MALTVCPVESGLRERYLRELAHPGFVDLHFRQRTRDPPITEGSMIIILGLSEVAYYSRPSVWDCWTITYLGAFCAGLGHRFV